MVKNNFLNHFLWHNSRTNFSRINFSNKNYFFVCKYYIYINSYNCNLTQSISFIAIYAFCNLLPFITTHLVVNISNILSAVFYFSHITNFMSVLARPLLIKVFYFWLNIIIIKIYLFIAYLCIYEYKYRVMLASVIIHFGCYW
jgi:hypothetical protein